MRICEFVGSRAIEYTDGLLNPTVIVDHVTPPSLDFDIPPNWELIYTVPRDVGSKRIIVGRSLSPVDAEPFDHVTPPSFETCRAFE